MWQRILKGFSILLASYIGIFVIIILSVIFYVGVFTKRSAEKVADAKLTKFCERKKIDCSRFIKSGPTWRSDLSLWVVDYHNELETINVIIYINPLGGTDTHSMME